MQSPFRPSWLDFDSLSRTVQVVLCFSVDGILWMGNVRIMLPLGGSMFSMVTSLQILRIFYTFVRLPFLLCFFEVPFCSEGASLALAGLVSGTFWVAMGFPFRIRSLQCYLFCVSWLPCGPPVQLWRGILPRIHNEPGPHGP